MNTDQGVDYVSLCKAGRKRIVIWAVIFGGLTLMTSSVSASYGKLVGIVGVFVALFLLGSAIWYMRSPSPLPMVLVGCGFLALLAWAVSDTPIASKTGVWPGPLGALGLCGWLGWGIYAFVFANKLKRSR